MQKVKNHTSPMMYQSKHLVHIYEELTLGQMDGMGHILIIGWREGIER